MLRVSAEVRQPRPRSAFGGQAEMACSELLRLHVRELIDAQLVGVALGVVRLDASEVLGKRGEAGRALSGRGVGPQK